MKIVSYFHSEIPIGTTCKNRGCNETYESPASSNTECVHHPGSPVFHEGLKFWSCCTKRTTDFAVFMSQKGCAYGQHKWIENVGIILKKEIISLFFYCINCCKKFILLYQLLYKIYFTVSIAFNFNRPMNRKK